jgi:acetyl esterase
VPPDFCEGWSLPAQRPGPGARYIRSALDPIGDYLAGLPLLDGVAGDVDVLVPACRRSPPTGILGRMSDSLPDLLADSQLADFVEASRAATGPTARQLGPQALRDAQRSRVKVRPPGPELASVEDQTVASGIGVRLYRPTSGPHPLLVFVHGGMWTIGDLESHDRACRRLATRVNVAVLAVDFRRAPEHPWPAAVDDVTDVVRWAFDHRAKLTRGSRPVLIAGDSSGGNLAALACLRLRDEAGPLPSAQVLAYPNTDLTLSQPSITEKGAGWGLPADDVAWGAELWVPDLAMRADPRVSPLHAPDLAGLPPALIVTAEHDPLRDEGDLFAARLAAAGVPVLHRREPRMVHGFLTLDTVSPAAAQAGERLFADISRLIATLP